MSEQSKAMSEICQEALILRELVKTSRVKANHDKAFELWCALVEENFDQIAGVYLKAVNALKDECGDRCAEQNPCAIKMVLRELGEM